MATALASRETGPSRPKLLGSADRRNNSGLTRLVKLSPAASTSQIIIVMFN